MAVLVDFAMFGPGLVLRLAIGLAKIVFEKDLISSLLKKFSEALGDERLLGGLFVGKKVGTYVVAYDQIGDWGHSELAGCSDRWDCRPTGGLLDVESVVLEVVLEALTNVVADSVAKEEAFAGLSGCGCACVF